MVRRIVLILISALCGLGLSPAQSTTPGATTENAQPTAVPLASNAVVAALAPRITAPFVAKPPAYARWTVRTEWAEAATNTPGADERPTAPFGPKTIEYIKGPNVGRQITTWSRGGQTVIWFYGQIMMEKFPVDAPIMVKELPPEGRRQEGVVGEFTVERFFNKYPGFEWLKPEFYVGEEQKNGFLCHHFKEAVPSAQVRVKLTPDEVAHYDEMDRLAEEEAAPEGGKKKARKANRPSKNVIEHNVMGYDREAWVMVDGRWPIALREGNVLRIYQHQEPPVPGAFPRMGPEFETLLAEYCQTWNLPPAKY